MIPDRAAQIEAATQALARAGSAGLSLTQSGYFRNYVLVFVGGALVAAVILLVRANS